MPLPISVTILTKNSSKYLSEVLLALKEFDEVLVCDTGSVDSTMELAKSFPNVTLCERPFIGFGPTHNVASSLCRHDWVLSIDSDEVVSPDMIVDLKKISPQLGCVYSFQRHNEYKGKWIKWCGWYPDRQIRLYNRVETSFCGAQVHEKILVKSLKEVPFNSHIKHYSYSQISDFLTKMQVYSDLFAKQNVGIQSSSFSKALSHGAFAFFKSYFLKKGFLGGQEGFEISFYNGCTAYYKYLKLAEANKAFKEQSSVEFCDVQRKKPFS